MCLCIVFVCYATGFFYYRRSKVYVRVEEGRGGLYFRNVFFCRVSGIGRSVFIIFILLFVF